MKKLAAILIATAICSEYAAAKCSQYEETVFSCLTGKSKLIEVCDAGKTLSYSFGFPNSRPEIVVTVPRHKASTYQWKGIGRYISYAVNIPNGNTVYSVFWGVDKMSDEHGIEAGVNVEINKKWVASVQCVGERNIVQNMEGIELRQVEY